MYKVYEYTFNVYIFISVYIYTHIFAEQTQWYNFRQAEYYRLQGILT